MSDLAPISPPDRLLCGPGPTNVDPAALEAMQKPMLGHLDPVLHEILLELVAMLRLLYKADRGLVLPLQATGSSGMEAGIINLVEPGDKVIIGADGYFGRRIIEVAERAGAEVIEVIAEWGEHVPNERLIDAADKHPDARLLAIVHAETSCGIEHPLAELAAAMKGRETMLFVDCVTSLGGVKLEFDEWGIDYAYSCTQKCVGSAPGMSPIAVSERALERARSRKTPIPYQFDFDLLDKYWNQRPAAYHHTAPVLHIYALHEVLRQTLLEGLDKRIARHTEAGTHFQQRVIDAGMEMLAEAEHRLPPLTAIRVPEGIDGKAVQTQMYTDHSIEIGGGLGPLAPAMWRVGLMGPNAHTETADRVFDALTGVLASQGVAVAG